MKAMNERRRYLNADRLAELFREMADFAYNEEARKVFLYAAWTVDEMPGVLIPDSAIPKGTEGTIQGETAEEAEQMFGGGVHVGRSRFAKRRRVRRSRSIRSHEEHRAEEKGESARWLN